MLKLRKEDKEYIDMKKVDAIVFNLFDKEKYYYFFEDINFMQLFKDTIKLYIELEYLDYGIRNNIYDVLFYLREINDEKRNSRIEIINEIIIFMQKPSEDKYIEKLYKEEYRMRTRHYYMHDRLDNLKNIILLSMSVDYEAIEFLLEDCTDEEFDEKLINAINNGNLHSFIYSFNAIISEQPGILSNKQFYNRALKTLNTIYELYDVKEIKDNGSKYKIIRKNKKAIRKMEK